jgi:diguanylate cyclase (GGDEF)-like protein
MKYIETDISSDIHHLLKTQLSMVKDDEGNIDQEKFLALVNQAYHESDFERSINENAMAVVSEEVMETNIELREQSIKLKQNEERYRLILQASSIILWEWDFESDYVEYAVAPDNESSERTIVKESFYDWQKRIHPNERNAFKTKFELMKEGQIKRLELEFKMKEKGSDYAWFFLRAVVQFNDQNKPLKILASIVDINQKKEYENQLYHAAFHDKVTGLPNRALFMDRLQQLLEKKRRLGEPSGAILFVDLDRFKFINDSFGHAAGDFVLQSIARRLEEVIRPGDTVCRFGGDEFLIILAELESKADARQISDRVIEEVSAPLEWREKTIAVSASVGVCMIDQTVKNSEDLIKFADWAMYNAKTKGKDQYQLFDNIQRELMQKKRKIEQDLPTAIERKEFLLYYQPIIDLKKGAIDSFETLVRWMHKGDGLISPADFIPIAEETGAIKMIGEFVLRNACEQQVFWKSMRKKGHIPSISVNVSVKQLLDDKQCDLICRVIDESGVDPAFVKLEITESVIMSDPKKAIKRLFHLKDKGVSLSIDDFGTGYSSLSYLHDFPFDVVKIDQAFVSRICSDQKSRRLVNGILTLADDMGFVVVAEGVETEKQYNILKDMNCGYGQGYFFAKPLTDDIARSLIIEDKRYGVDKQLDESDLEILTKESA